MRLNVRVAIVAGLLVLSGTVGLIGPAAALHNSGHGGTVGGDWVINSNMLYENVTITVIGNVIINAQLTLRNVTLIIDDATLGNGTRIILVNPGGGLIIEDIDNNNRTAGDGSLITSINENNQHRYSIIAVGATLRIKNSELRELGFDDPAGTEIGLLTTTPRTLISRNIIRSPFLGTGLVNTANANITGNTYIDTVNADVLAFNCTNVTVFDNDFRTSGRALPFTAVAGQFSTGLTVTNNTVGTRLIGTYFEAVTNLTVANNNIGVQGWFGIYANASTTVDVQNNVVTAPFTFDGIWVNSSTGVTVQGNSVTGAAGNGIVVSNANQAAVAGNTVRGSRGAGGIYFFNALSSSSAANVLSGNSGLGIVIDSSAGLVSTMDMVSTSGVGGVYVSRSANVVLDRPTLSANGDFGVYADAGSLNAWLENGTVDTHAVADLMANGSSQLTALNTTFTTTQTTNNSLLAVLWYLHAQVLDSVGAPAPGATVTLRNAGGSLVATKTSDATGRADWFVATGFVESSTGRDYTENDHVLRATLAPLNGTTAVNATSTQVVTIDMNRAPQIASLPAEIRFQEDTQATLDLDTVFTDDDPLTFAVTAGANITAVLDAVSHVVTVGAPADWSGSSTLGVNATDTHGLATARSVPVVIEPVNDAPQISGLVADVLVDEDDAPFTLDPSAQGVDADLLYGDSLQWYVTGENPRLLTVSGENTTGPLVLTFLPDANGIDDVLLWVEDEAKAQASRAFRIEVRPVNDDPAFTSEPVLEATIGTVAYDYDADAADIDAGDVLGYVLVIGPKAARIDKDTGRIQWDPTEGDEGRHDFEVEVTDGKGGSARQTFVVLVHPRPNRAPMFTSTPGSAALAREPYSYAPAGSDPDNDTLTISLVKGPPGLTLGADGTVRWTPTDAQVGGHDVTLKISDGELSANQTFRITVTAATAPHLEVDRPLDKAKLTAGVIVISGTAMNGTSPVDRVEVIIDGVPAGLAEGTGAWSYEWKAKPGKHDITVRVVDLRGRVTESTISVTVRERPSGFAAGGGLTPLLLLVVVALAIVGGVIAMRSRRQAPPPDGVDGAAHSPAGGTVSSEPPAPGTPPEGPAPTPDEPPTADPPVATPAPAPAEPAPAATVTPQAPQPAAPLDDLLSKLDAMEVGGGPQPPPPKP